MQKGRVLAIDTPDRVAASFGRRLFGIRAAHRYQVLKALREFPHVGTVYPFGEDLHYTDARSDAGDADISREVAAFLAARGFEAERIEAISPGVEDTFIARMTAAGDGRG